MDVEWNGGQLFSRPQQEAERIIEDGSQEASCAVQLWPSMFATGLKLTEAWNQLRQLTQPIELSASLFAGGIRACHAPRRFLPKPVEITGFFHD